MIGNNEILRDIDVWNDQTINANCLEGPSGTGASGNPPHKHHSFVACSIGCARKSGMKSSRSRMRLAYSSGPRTARVVCGQYQAMFGKAIAGTRASTRSLFGLSQV